MANIINRSKIPALLRPGLKLVYGDYHTWGDLYSSIYKKMKSDKAVESEVEMRGAGMGGIKQDGGPVMMGSMSQGFTTNYVHNFYGIGFQITQAAIEDNLYEAEFPQMAAQSRASMESLRNTNAMYVFNNAFNSKSTGGDGQPLCSLLHPIDGGVNPNMSPVRMGLNESALEAAFTTIKLWRNLAGLPIQVQSRKLLVPPRLAFQASRLLNTTSRVGTANNDINVIKHDNYLPDGVVVNPFLNNPYNFFILTDHPQGFKMYQKNEIDSDFQPDIYTKNTLVTVTERYSMFYTNHRCVYGVQGAA